MHILKKMFRIFLWVTGSVVLLFILCIFLLRLPSVQNYITQKAVDYLERKTGTEVRLERLYVGFPKSIVMEGLYMEDQQRDTLIDLRSMEVDMDMWALWNNRLEVNYISVNGLNSHVYTVTDGTFNYQYILNAFSNDQDQSADAPREKGLGFTLEKVYLRNVQFGYEDANHGLQLDTRLGKLEADMEEFNPVENRFHVGRIHLSNADIAYVQSQQASSSEFEGFPALDLDVEAIVLDSVQTHYRSIPNGQTIDLELGHFAVYPTNLDLQNQLIQLDQISLSDSDLAYVIDSSGALQDTVVTTTARESLIPEPLSAWTIKWREFEAARNAVRYEDNSYPRNTSGLDYHHMHWRDIHFTLRDFSLSYPEIQMDILGMRGTEYSGIELRELTAAVKMDGEGIQLEHAHINTPHTELRFDASTSYSDPMDLIQRPEHLIFDFDLSESILGFRDILYFQSQLKDQVPFAGNQYGHIQVRTRLKGKIGQLVIEELNARYGGVTQVRMNGRIEGLPKLESARFDLKFPHIVSTRSQVQQFLPDGSLPEHLHLPEQFTASGRFNGRIDDFDSQFNVQTTLGRIQGVASMEFTDSGVPIYTADLNLAGFDLGTFLQDSSFGMVNAQVQLEGRQFDWKKMQAELQTTVGEFGYRGYRYRDISLDARVDSQQIKIRGEVRDSHMVLDIWSELNLRDDLTYRGLIDVKGADLQAMQFTDEDIRAKGVFRFDGKGTDPDSLKGNASFSKILILKDGEQYRMDSIYAAVNTMDSLSRLDLSSDFLHGYLEGNVDPVQFAGVFRRHIEQYLDTPSRDTLIAGEKVQQLDFEFTLEESSLMTEVFVPKLEKLAPGSISGYYNSKARDMEIDVYLPEIIYDGTTVDSLNIYVTSARRSMDFMLRAETVMNPSLRVDNPALIGSVQNRTLAISLDIAEDTSYQDILLSGRLNMEDSNYVFRFDRNGVVLDNETWQVSEDHMLQFGSKGFHVQNMQISHDGRSVTFIPENDEALKVVFERFSLQDISQAFQRQQEPVTGLLNGHVLIKSTKDAYLYRADLTVEDLRFMEFTIGTLAVLLENPESDLYEIDAQLSGDGNKANLKGQYDMRADPTKMNLTADINELQMKSLEAFTAGQLSRTKGYIDGKLSITGPLEHPGINGHLNFRDASMHVKRLGTSFALSEEAITFNTERVRFDNFSIIDSLGNHAMVNGLISLDDFNNPAFKLDAQIDQFLLFSKKPDREELFYGQLIMNSEIRIRGTLDQPVINATAHVVEGSDVVMVIPTEDPRLETTGGIDEFIDRDIERHRIMTIQDESDTIKSEIRGIDLRASISANRQSEIRIFLDRSGGNYLRIRGDADIIFSIDPNGTVRMTGRYEIFEGEYQLLFRNVVRRSFQLQEGSSIIWTGDPMQARVNLRAIHTKEAEPLGLVRDQLSGEEPENMNRFRQVLPFQIELKMNEELISPYIDFDISLPNEHRGAVGGQVQARLNQLNQNESAVNKQVFSLLVLGRFVPEDPFAVKGNGGAESAARRSVTRVLNAQLDKLSDKYINAVDLELNLESYEDYSEGAAMGRTELNVGLGKAFFNDRLRVRVGGNIDLEGDQRRQQQAGDLIGDISVEYALTEDGTWKLRAFRKNEYEGIIDGDIIKTGTSLIFSRDFNSFGELFHRSAKQDSVQ